MIQNTCKDCGTFIHSPTEILLSVCEDCQEFHCSYCKRKLTTISEKTIGICNTCLDLEMEWNKNSFD